MSALAILVLAAAARVSYAGFSIEPPTDGAWTQVRDTDAAVVFMKRLDHEAHTFGVAVLSRPIRRRFQDVQELRTWVLAQKTQNPNPARYSMEYAEASPEGPGPMCVRYVTRVIDGGPPDFEQPRSLTLNVTGFACLHPDAPSQFYDIQYSERRPGRKGRDRALALEGEAFIKAFRFEAPPDAPVEDSAPPPARDRT